MTVDRYMFKSLQLPKAFKAFIIKGQACFLLAFFVLATSTLDPIAPNHS